MKRMCILFFISLYSCTCTVSRLRFLQVSNILFCWSSPFCKEFILCKTRKEHDRNWYECDSLMIHFNKAGSLKTHCCAPFLLYYSMYNTKIVVHSNMFMVINRYLERYKSRLIVILMQHEEWCQRTQASKTVFDACISKCRFSWVTSFTRHEQIIRFF